MSACFKAGFATTVNGHFSAADAKELAKFRKSIGLNQLSWTSTGKHGPLFATTPHLEVGDKGKNVVRLQLALRSAGFVKIPTTGKYSVSTAAVIKTVQKSRHLKRTGQVNADFWKSLQAGKITATTVVAKKPIPKPVSQASKTGTKGEKALAFAKKHSAIAMRMGAGPNGWDCSGLTMKAWKAAGSSCRIRPGSSTALARRSPSPSSGTVIWSSSTRIRHVALYAGNGKVIHAPHPGKKVTYIKMKYMPYMGARRPG
jgi:cell wall-associated NlpC family hydrolase